VIARAPVPVEEPARQHLRDPTHHADLVLERGLEGQDVIAIHEQVLPPEVEDVHLLPAIGQVELPVSLGLGQTDPL
jgi:hypothetical protein